MNTNVKCKHCGWVHFSVTRAFAEAGVKSFNDYFATLSPKDRNAFYGNKNSSIENYQHCQRCGKTEFMPAEFNDCPDGVTISPIIWDHA